MPEMAGCTVVRRGAAVVADVVFVNSRSSAVIERKSRSVGLAASASERACLAVPDQSSSMKYVRSPRVRSPLLRAPKLVSSEMASWNRESAWGPTPKRSRCELRICMSETGLPTGADMSAGSVRICRAVSDSWFMASILLHEKGCGGNRHNLCIMNRTTVPIFRQQVQLE